MIAVAGVVALGCGGNDGAEDRPPPLPYDQGLDGERTGDSPVPATEGPSGRDETDGEEVGESGGDDGEIGGAAAEGLADEVPATRARDPWLRPFSASSIWNTAIGSDATYEPADLPWTERHFLEHVYLLRTTSDDPARRLIRNGHWRDRCSGTEDSGRTLYLPDGWQPEEVSDTKTPNNPGVFLQPDGRTLVEVNAMGRCEPDGPLFGQWGAPNEYIIDIYGDGLRGNRGASRLSQFGGAVRDGELSGDQPIAHALDLLVWAEHLYWGGSRDSSYRWPATDSDSYAGPDTYRGTNPELRMGSLLAIPPTITAEDIGVTTPVGLRLFDAFRDYGAYITDDSAWDATYLGVESTAIGTFDWDDPERDDMARIVQHLHVVTDNSPSSIGGGGAPRRPPHPELIAPD